VQLAALAHEVRIAHRDLKRENINCAPRASSGRRILGEFLKSRGNRRLIQAATVLLPSIELLSSQGNCRNKHVSRYFAEHAAALSNRN